MSGSFKLCGGNRNRVLNCYQITALGIGHSVYTMWKKRHLHQYKHPFNECPFEALCCGSWHAVDYVKIRHGTLTIHSVDDEHLIEDRVPYPNIRIKSRQATLSDCTCFLRAEIDICVLSTLGDAASSDDQVPVWTDARISSIKRKPHDTQCSCEFYVNFYVNQGPLGSEKGTLSKDITVVGIEQIAILQRLEKDPCVGHRYRWHSSEDCSTLSKTKLFMGKLLCDISWLIVASALRKVIFKVRSVDNRIVYQILADDYDIFLRNSGNGLDFMNFRVDNGVSAAAKVQSSLPGTPEADLPSGNDENETSPGYDIMNLRRSKRRNVKPERYVGCDISPDQLDISFVRTPYKTGKWEGQEEEEEEEEEMLLPLSSLFNIDKNFPEDHDEGEKNSRSGKMKRKKRELIVYKRRNKKKVVKSEFRNKEEEQNQLAIVPLLTESFPIAVQQDHNHLKSPGNYSAETKQLSWKHCHKDRASHTKRPGVYSGEASEDSLSYCYTDSIYHAKGGGICSGKAEEISLEYCYADSVAKVQRKHIDELEDIMIGSTREEKVATKKVERKSCRPLYSKRQSLSADTAAKKRTLSAGAYNKLINSYMKKIDTTMNKEDPSIVDQWNEFKEAKSSSQKREMDQSSIIDVDETSEIEMLWKEMELCLAQIYLEENNEDCPAGDSTTFVQIPTQHCYHDFRLDEEIGIVCRKCDFVKTEIKHVSAPFMQYSGSATENKLNGEGEIEEQGDVDETLNFVCPEGPADAAPSSEENENVWALIPELRKKLHLHQKKAFEFLWKNVAGSLIPSEMNPSSKKLGGCVVSHSPGAGKTFLIIAFLASYLKLFPGKRPLVLAPKTTLYTWYKEFIKWNIPIPVHLIHGRRTYRVCSQKTMTFRGVPKPSNDVMHVLDCLEKIQKWHARPSVLVMGYTSFLTLMREDSKFEHRKHMAKVLRESPGLLILDEGHNPRSTKSRLRKVLMKVETDLRILLSGTLFQNNFCEYFNTLCLARPKFIVEVLKALNPKFKKKKNATQKSRHLMEARARKFFLDNIAKKIDSDDGEERMEGLNMLRNLTSGFIDVYEGGSSDGLPGLQIYTILMNSTEMQQEILVKLQDIMSGYSGYPLELELLITLAAMHPWLIKSSACVNKFFNMQELRELEKFRYDFKKGAKVMFVLNLVFRVIREEKVLIFCHNIAPINLFVELFEKVFSWSRNREILVLTGDLELFDRGRVMDRFEEPGGASRILLASITACAEGISLTAASRVILLDSEWNPSKTKQAIARAFRPGQRKVVYVYQLLATGTLEEDKYKRTTWKEWVSCMIFSEDVVEDPSRWQAHKIEDDILREMVEEDRRRLFHAIMKNEKASTDSSKKRNTITGLISDGG